MTRKTFTCPGWKRQALSFTLAWQVIGQAAYAEDAPRPPVTLQAAIALATQTHPSIEASRLGIAQAQAATREAWSGFKPRVSLAGGVQHGLSTGAARPQLQLNAIQPLYDGNQTLLAVRQAELSEASAGLDRIAVRRRIAYETARAYFAVLQAESLREAARHNVEQAKEQLSLAELRAQGQVGTRMEVLQAAGAIATAQDGYLQAVNQVRQTRETLESFLGHPLGDAALNRMSALKHVAYDPEQVARALDARPDVGQAILAREVQDVAVAQRSRLTWPTLSAVGDLATAEDGTRQTVSASLSWPFLDGERTAAQVEQARLGIARAEATLAAVRREATLEIRLAAETLHLSQERVKVAQEGLQAATEGLVLAKVRFARGVGTGLEVINALSMLSQAQSAYIQGTFAVQTSQLRLAQALGIDAEDLIP